MMKLHNLERRNKEVPYGSGPPSRWSSSIIINFVTITISIIIIDHTTTNDTHIWQ